jgi:hypothetical protein
MFPIKPVLKVHHVDAAILSGTLGILPDGLSSPKSPKINELRARYEALQKPGNNPK